MELNLKQITMQAINKLVRKNKFTKLLEVAKYLYKMDQIIFTDLKKN